MNRPASNRQTKHRVLARPLSRSVAQRRPRSTPSLLCRKLCRISCPFSAMVSSISERTPISGLLEITVLLILRRKRTESPGDFHSTGASYVRARTVGGRNLRVPSLTVLRTRYIKGSQRRERTHHKSNMVTAERPDEMRQEGARDLFLEPLLCFASDTPTGR
jgi:hypothetical protein